MHHEKADPTPIILAYLKRNTDEHHVATRQQITDYVQDALDVRMSEKAFARIMRKLQESGQASEYDRKEGGYRIAQRDFTETQAYYLCGLLDSFPRLSPMETTQLFNQIASTQSSHVERNLRSFTFHCVHPFPKPPANVLENISLLRKAISEECVASYSPVAFNCESCQYFMQRTPRKCEPRFLLFFEGRPYVLATDHSQEETPHLFHIPVDRMANIIVTDNPSPFISHAIASEAAGYWEKMDGSPEEALLKCTEDMADIVACMKETTRIKPCDKHHFFLEAKASRQWILRFAMQYAGKAELLKPVSMRKEIFEMLEKAASTYK